MAVSKFKYFKNIHENSYYDDYDDPYYDKYVYGDKYPYAEDVLADSGRSQSEIKSLGAAALDSLNRFAKWLVSDSALPKALRGTSGELSKEMIGDYLGGLSPDGYTQYPDIRGAMRDRDRRAEDVMRRLEKEARLADKK